MKRSTQGFTLVEILIVVIILGILAAIVIPEFTQASEDARQSAIVSDLQTVRSQIELYKVQHNGLKPTADIVDQLTKATTTDGTVDDANGVFGPYLQKFPSNPCAPKDPTGVDTEGDPGTGDEGWHYNPTTGDFHANDADHKDL